MDAPTIRYAKAADGVSIAYAALGDGPPVVFPTRVWGDVHLYTSVEPFRPYFRALAERGWRVIFYDGRGMGSSQRDVTDLSLQARILDLEAVIEATCPDSLALCGNQSGGPTAVSYSCEHPERVSQLVLVNTFASGVDYMESLPSIRVAGDLRHIAEDQWEFYSLAVANALTAFSHIETARRLAEAIRSSVSPKVFLADRDAILDADVTEMLSSVTVPVLVVHDKRDAIGDMSGLASKLASRIPAARFVATDDAPHAIDEFLREGETRSSERALPSGTAIILFADIADSTSLTERLGDAAFREKARDLDAALRAAITDRNGTPIEGKLLGDGVLATFASAKDAIEAALACGERGRHAGLLVHVGLHAGDVIREENNVFGGAVNIASRISELSAPGEVLVSDIVRGLARTSAGVSFEDRGEHALKGVSEPVRVFTVRSQE